MSNIRKHKLFVNVGIIFVFVSTLMGVTVPTMAAGTCGTGTWTSGNLEIHHINIGQGDATLIVGPTGRTLLFDAGESNWNSSAKAQIIGPYIESILGCKSLDYVVISHFHLDHIGYVGYGGLWNLVEIQGFTVGTTLVRNYNTYLGDVSGTFNNWKTYLEGVGLAKLNPTTAVEGTGQVNLGIGVSFRIVTVDGNGAIIAGDFRGDASPPSENDYSIGVVLSYGDFDEWIGGDLDGQYEIGGFGYTYHDIELSVAPEVGDVDVYKANHHASSHSSSSTFINQLDPEVSVVTVGNGNTYGHPTQAIMNRLLATSTVYLTERGDTNTNIGSAIVAGNIVIKTSSGATYTVNGTAYTATEPLRTDADGDGYFAEADPNDNNSSLVPAPNGGCGPIYQTCVVSCQVTAGEVLINEVLPAPSSGTEWVELYNVTASTINLGYCYIDDIAAGSAAYQIPAGTLIPAHGFWTLDRTNYFNNTGDDVRFLKEDANTVLDSYTYGNTGSDLSWYRSPNGGPWAVSPTASTTKGRSNNTPYVDVTISGNAGVAGATLSFVDGTLKTVTSNGSGNYSFTVPYGWSGTVTPSLGGTTFCPASKTYSSLTANQPAQNYTPTACAQYNPLSLWTTDFSYSPQGWRADLHPRVMGDVNGDGKDDIVGFGYGGVLVGLSNGTGFNPATRWTTDFSYNQGWRMDTYPRMVGDVNGDGRDDIVGFGYAGAVVALSNGSSFDALSLWTTDFSYFPQGWRADLHPRVMGDVNGDGRDDIVGFGYGGVLVALSNGSSFDPATRWTTDFSYNQGWRMDTYPRMVGDVNGDGKDDIVGFGYAGVVVALSNGTSFAPLSLWTSDFSYYPQGWRANLHPRVTGDANGDGKDDIFGFGYGGVLVGLSNGVGIGLVSNVTTDFSYNQGWRMDLYPRMVGDVNGDGKADIVGFGYAGAVVATAK